MSRPEYSRLAKTRAFALTCSAIVAGVAGSSARSTTCPIGLASRLSEGSVDSSSETPHPKAGSRSTASKTNERDTSGADMRHQWLRQGR